MFILGIFFIIISVLILYKRAKLIIFGKKADGEIIGYCNKTKGIHGTEAYNYKIKYVHDGKEYIASSLENIATFSGNVSDKNMYKQVTVYFRADNPKTVTIADFHTLSLISVGFFILGAAALFV